MDADSFIIQAIAMRNPLLLLLSLCVWFGLLLAGCQGRAQALETPQISPTQPKPTVTSSLVVVATQKVAAARLPSATPDAPKASLKPVVTATPKDPQETASPERRICSPLVHHGLDELAGIVSDPYHPPPMGKDDRHQGVDFSYYRQAGRATIEGEGVQSVMSGRVAAAIQDSFPFGNLVIIESTRGDLPDGLQQVLNLAEDQSLYVLYAHLEEAPLVQSGDAVQACQALGAVGKSGNAGVAHLHLETRVGPVGAVFSELAYYTPQASQSARANYVLWRMSGVFEHFDPMLLLGYRQAK
jgi:murein DD-endopeptidase MepM/ murein hydrolase activator NlpD